MTLAKTSRLAALSGFYSGALAPGFNWQGEQQNLFSPNRGVQVQNLAGINGVLSGGTAQCKLDVGLRYHNIVFQCSAFNAAGNAAGVVPTIVTAGGFTNTTGKVKWAVTNGVVTALTYTAGDSAGATTATVLSVPDATGGTITLTCTAAGTGALGNATFVASQVITPCSPAFFFGTNSIQLSVDGTVMRDIQAQDILNINAMNAHPDQYGQLSIHFREPWRRWTRGRDYTSWDLTPNADGTASHTSFTFQAGIPNTVTSPTLTAVVMFDSQTTTRTDPKTGQQVRVVRPITQHRYPQPTLGTGQQAITTIPAAHPIQRIWALGGTAGNITGMDVYADKVYRLQASQAQIATEYAQYGITFNQLLPAGSPSSAATSSTPTGTTSNSYDVGFVSDPDEILGDSLKVLTSLQVNIYNAISQTVLLVVEYSPGAFTG